MKAGKCRCRGGCPILKVLKTQGKIVIALPVYFKKGRLIRIRVLKEIIDLGFKQVDLLEGAGEVEGELENNFVYHRLGQFVGREIFVFQKV